MGKEASVDQASKDFKLHSPVKSFQPNLRKKKIDESALTFNILISLSFITNTFYLTLSLLVILFIALPPILSSH